MSFRGWQKVTINTPKGAVEGIAPVVISASRATDIPAFYSDWFVHRMRIGYVKWFNRFNGQPTYVSFAKTSKKKLSCKIQNPLGSSSQQS
jgi:hypothetical protein